MPDYKIGGPLKQFTAIEKTTQMAAFLEERMVKAIEGNDAVEGAKASPPSAIRDRVLVSLTTCETAVSTATAVGAELRP